MQQESRHKRSFRSFVLACALAALLLLSTVTAAAACRPGSSARPGKAPVAPSKAVPTPKPAPSVKACPSSARYNPKTGSCERYRF
ncbi:MAG TPA: hypothetical protein VII83_06375 [Gaiellaceae bacterium]